MSRIRVVGDPQQFVRIMNKEMQCPTEVEVIVEDIRRCAQISRSCSFQFVRRWANG
ncbi:hypothetical protein RHGRI_037653 [Rhododendron griersonianum]|uniref:Uncharacterized protein n=1 Tax=Rhododendron griersonianum TaxID=479676 RepID=A0AAV6HWU3_9ERIC|nr:hypothetical protein RHGRI_037653 [Rhododendron griersonianum]